MEATFVAWDLTSLSACHFKNGLKPIADIAPIIAMTTINSKSENPLTLEDLSNRYGVSRERIRQIEAKAFEKLQIKMTEKAKGINLLQYS